MKEHENIHNPNLSEFTTHHYLNQQKNPKKTCSFNNLICKLQQKQKSKKKKLTKCVLDEIQCSRTTMK